jgi:hypothetical protein
MERRFYRNQPPQAQVDKKFVYTNQLEGVTFREYGRNIQNMARHLLTVEDKEKRTRMAITLVELMKQLNPVVGEPNDYYQKLWDHLYVMTDMKLEVDAPFPKPESDTLVRKPRQVPYRIANARFKHYGKNIELLIEKVKAIQNEEEREQATLYLGRMMKTLVLTHSKEILEDGVVIENIKNLSKGALVLDPEKVAAYNLLSINPKEIMQNNPGGGQSQNQRHGHQHNRNRGGHKHHNKRRR